MKVIIISGPTATGKTELSIELAQKFAGEIVNFDSLLLYKEINIGTAKPNTDERRLVPHHMIDVRSIAQSMNAADYAREAYPIVEHLLQKNKIVFNLSMYFLWSSSSDLIFCSSPVALSYNKT